MMKRWKPALLWSTLGTFLIAALQVWVQVGAGMSARDAAAQAAWWLVVWPAFFFAIWLLTSWRDFIRRRYEVEAAYAARQALARPAASPGAPCPSCGSVNPPVALVCVGCGHRFRDVEVVHELEMLPGARESAPSVLYVVAVIASFFAGALAVAVIGLINQRLLEQDWVLLGAFLLGASGGIAASFTAIRAWVDRRARRKGVAGAGPSG